MLHHDIIHRRNVILFLIIAAIFFIQVTINIYIEGLASVFPPGFLFLLGGTILGALILKKVNPIVTMYVMVSGIYVYFYFLLNDSPYLVNYMFMWLGLPLSAIYQHYRVVLLAGAASILLTFYSFFTFHEELFPNVVQEDFVYLVLFGVFCTGFLLIFIRVTMRLWQEVQEANLKLEELAYHDPLTGASNRLLLKKRFEEVKQQPVNSIAIVFIDMDHFKLVNDTYGHDAGDYLLMEVVSRVKTTLQENDLLCRLGGDEFVILLPDVEGAALVNRAEHIRATLDEPIAFENKLIEVSASFGSTFTMEIGQANLDDMLKQADAAMYVEKERDNNYFDA